MSDLILDRIELLALVTTVEICGNFQVFLEVVLGWFRRTVPLELRLGTTIVPQAGCILPLLLKTSCTRSASTSALLRSFRWPTSGVPFSHSFHNCSTTRACS